MDILLTFDYELFFGRKTGSAEFCMVRPTKVLMERLDAAGIKATIFVDIGYIVRCKTLGRDIAGRDMVIEQLSELHANGHDLQLHIHPHWEDAEHNSNGWDLSATRYRLHQFSKSNVEDIVSKYSEALTELTGTAPIAYRAGGWCVQPFEHMAAELFDVGIRVDSTVFRYGRNVANVHGFDFYDAPDQTSWRFDDDPVQMVDDGRYWELPISSLKVPPVFYWKFAGIKKFSRQKHRAYGDGSSIPLNKKQVFNLLTKYSYTVVSMDGYKSSLLELAYRRYRRHYGENAELVLIGHPKATTDYSIRKTGEFISKHIVKDRFLTTKQWYKERSKGAGRKSGI